ncbi:MAG: 30S ribosomal protein S19e [Candidatus Micrarchaeota archaeon]
MVSALDVNARIFVLELAKALKENDKIKPPEWAKFVKTGVNKERKPVEADWWHIRCASILRKISIDGVVGVGKLRTFYGSRKSRGSKPERHMPAGGNIIRKALQQLEAAGYVKKKDKGRMITPAGSSIVGKTALKVKKMKAV